MSPALLLQIRALRIPSPETEYRFHPVRRWRFDFAWPEQRVAVEVDGATWTHGRHTRGIGYAADCEKINTATEIGWRVYRFTTDQVRNGTAVMLLKRVLTTRI